jgi:hypothetical protein
MKYEKPKGRRLKRYFMSVCPTEDSPVTWWDHVERRWVKDLPKDHDASTDCTCRTVRAFCGHLRRHPELDNRAVLISRYVGYDVYSGGYLAAKEHPHD